MNKVLWRASKNLISKSNLQRFERFLSKNSDYKISRNYPKLLEWSIKNRNKFWSSVWDFAKVKGEKKKSFIIQNSLYETNTYQIQSSILQKIYYQKMIIQKL